MLRSALFKSLAACSLVAATAAAQETRSVARVLVDRQLRERTVQLTALDSQTVSYTDAAGLVRSEPVSEYLAILSPVEPSAGKEPAPGRAWSILELADGERLFGDVAPGDAPQDTVRWSHPVLGPLDFKLDQLRRIRLDMPPAGSWTKPPAAAEAQPSEDVVLLANGDRLSGLVEGLAGQPRQLKLAPTDKGESRAIGLDVVREIVFANPPQQQPARASLVWLRDGSIIACRSIATNRMGELVLQPALLDTEASPDTRPAGRLRLEDLVGVAFQPGALVALSSLAPQSQTPTGERRWTRPIAIANADHAVLSAGDVELPGPMNVEWDLPAGAAQLGCTAELPRQMWTWGDCQVIVSVPGESKELFRARLNADQPQARIAVPLAGARRLSIRVEAGSYGPVQDRVVLRRPVLLLDHR